MGTGKKILLRGILRGIKFSIVPLILAGIYWLITKELRTAEIIFLAGMLSEGVWDITTMIANFGGTITITEGEEKITWSMQLNKDPDVIAKKETIIIAIRDERRKHVGDTNIS